MLAQEREVIVIDALVRMGKRSEAQSRANRFRVAYPGSGHARRVETILAE